MIIIKGKERNVNFIKLSLNKNLQNIFLSA